MIAVGIDPGTSTGVATWDCSARRFIKLDTMDFWSCFVYVTVNLKGRHDKILVVAEDPGLNKPVFPRGTSSQAVRSKIAQNVGMNKKEADLLIEGIRKCGVPVRTIRPNKSKLNADQFKQMTGYQGRTNEHKRDAGRLVYGTPEMPDKQYKQISQQLINAN